MVAGDSSDEGSDSEDGTNWGHPPTSIVVGSEEGMSSNTPPSCNSQQHTPVLGGPFSALIPSMWPQDILGQTQQVRITFYSYCHSPSFYKANTGS